MKKNIDFSTAGTDERVSLIEPQLEKFLSSQKITVIAVDGACGSGKTSFAAELTSRFGAAVIHMDNFFLPFQLRSNERLSEPGGNIHYERFEAEILPKLRSGCVFDYGVFDCSCGMIASRCSVSASSLIIAEGSYSLHPRFGKYYDLSVFLTVSPLEQQKRIEARVGKTRLSDFIDKWIPLENHYFSGFEIAEKADIIM